jgi:hypothetical protein
MTRLFCPLFQRWSDDSHFVVVNRHHGFHATALRILVDSSYLGISLDLASEEEWLLTASTDTTRNNGNRCRLVNPMTNQPFTQHELRIIYTALSRYTDNSVKTRIATEII